MANIQKELKTFFESEAGESLIGNIVLKAISQSMIREVRFEDGKSEPGRVVEKTEKVNVLDWLMKYLPHVEGAIRGCQSDSAQARNRANEVITALDNIPVLHLAEGAMERLKELPE